MERLLKPYIFSLSILLFLFFESNGQVDNYGFSKTPLIKTYSTDDYSGGIQNWDFTQDERGFLYVANNFGLLEFDGSSWNMYSISNSTRLRSVFADGNGRIYVGGQNQFGYFQSNAEGKLTFSSLYDSLPPEDRNLEDIWKIIKHEDKVYFSSYLATIVYDGNSVKKLGTSEAIKSVFKVAANLYGQSNDQGLYQISSYSEGSSLLSKDKFSDEIRGIVPLNNNSLLVFEKNGNLSRLRNNMVRKWFPEISSFLKKALVNTVLLLQNQNIAIGTQNNGIIIISQDGTLLHHISNDKGLANRTVLALHEDQFENLWIGLNNGISKVELASPFSLVNEESDLPGTGYCAELYKNKLYLGTSNGLFYQDAFHDLLAEDSGYEMVEQTGGQVYSVKTINNDVLLGHHNGAYVISDNKAKQIYDKSGVWKFISLPGTDNILAGTYRGFTLFEKSGNKFIAHDVAGFNESSRVFQFLDDSTLFMTHGYKGIFKLTFSKDFKKINKVSFYDEGAGLPSNILNNVYDIGGGDLIFAAQQGIYIYNRQTDRFEHHERLEKLLGEHVQLRAISADLTGNIYFITQQEFGVLQLTPQGDYIKNTKDFAGVIRYLSDDLENISIIDHENVLLGAKEGFVHYNPSISPNISQELNVFIRSISATENNGSQINEGIGELSKIDINLAANFTSLKFKFSSPYFIKEGELKYQYLLEDFDDQWSDWGLENEKEYTNLLEGEYIFKVRAQNSYGDISDITNFTFNVYPPWYRSKIAYTIYGLLFFMLFGVYMFLLDRKFRKEKKSLTSKQREELLKKESEIEEVSKKSEQELTKLRNDKLRSEIDHKNRELATTTMHLINKNEFMLKIRDVLKENAKADNKDQFKRIIKDIDRNLSEDEGWDQFTKHFDQVHGEFLTNIKKENPELTPQDIKLCAYLRMNMSSKEIANLLNISVRGVEIGRYRLRKKLGISRETNLVDYMLEYS
ncbi:MAG: hypothetical protein JXR10_18215 [Cyclobacteriaceae bacterium]